MNDTEFGTFDTGFGLTLHLDASPTYKEYATYVDVLGQPHSSAEDAANFFVNHCKQQYDAEPIILMAIAEATRRKMDVEGIAASFRATLGPPAASPVQAAPLQPIDDGIEDEDDWDLEVDHLSARRFKIGDTPAPVKDAEEQNEWVLADDQMAKREARIATALHNERLAADPIITPMMAGLKMAMYITVTVAAALVAGVFITGAV